MAKILLVEDDKSLREIYGVRLLAEGYDIVSAGDGEEALAAAIKERPDLILSDVMMPKISGFDMLDILRSTPETRDMKVIIMTALSSEDQRVRGENLGADVYLVKSQVGIEDVVKAIKDTLASSNQSQNQTPTSTPTPDPSSTTNQSVAPAPKAADIAAESAKYTNLPPEQFFDQNNNFATPAETPAFSVNQANSGEELRAETPEGHHFSNLNDRTSNPADNLTLPQRPNFDQPIRPIQSSTPNPAPNQWPNQNV